MKQTTLRTVLAASIAFLIPLAGYSQQQLGGTTADKKMQDNSSSISVMGGLYTPSLYDGTANINIPIYQYSADGGSYGISLGYNTRGVKVSELASQVGLHWNLIAGGSIQRVVKDLPDDIYTENYDDIEVNGHILVNPEKKLKGRLVVYGETSIEAAEDSVYRDRESDDYIVSIGNLSFTFNIGKDGYIFTIPQRNVKVELLRNTLPVEWLPSSLTMGTLEFRITDEQGNRYFFSGGDYTSQDIVDKYGMGINIGSYTYCMNWQIKKIITVSGKEINYNYSYNTHYYPCKIYSDVQPESQVALGGFASDNSNYLRLDSVNYPNGTTAWVKYGEVNTRADDYSSAVNEIRLVAGGQTQLSYKMNYRYFVASNLEATEPNKDSLEIGYGTGPNYLTLMNYRLKLNSITIASNSAPEELFYSFEYSPRRLPKRFNGSEDFFGYYNGNTPVQYYSSSVADPDLSIPYHTPFGGFIAPYGVNKIPNADSAQACILTKIKNAYGGEVEFRYGVHALSNVLLTSNTPGLPSSTDGFFMGSDANDGVRLDTIVEKDIFHTENYRLTLFSYDVGQRFISGGYFSYPFLLYNSDHTTKQIRITSQYASRHQLINGANHGYSLVGVKQVDQNNNQLSRTEYLFTNFQDGSSDPKYQRVGPGSKYFFQFPFSEKQFLRDWEMGLPLSIKEYDQNNRITSETTNTYAFSIDSTSSYGKIENTRVATVQTDYYPSMYSVPYSFDQIDTYRPFRGRAQLISTEIKNHISDSHFTDEVETYTYDSHDNVIKVLQANSKGDYIKTENIYNYNLDLLLGSGLQTFTDAGLEKVVSTQRWKTDASGNTHTQLLDGFISTFDYSGQQIKPKAVYNFTPGDAVSRNMYTGYSGSGPIPNPHGKIIQAFNGTVPDYFRKTSEVILSDAKGNPLESRIGDQDVFKAMIWDERTGQKLAEASSCHYVDIAYCGFETPGTGLVTMGNVKYNSLFVQSTPGGGSLYAAAFALSPSSGTIEGGQTLLAGKEYFLSFWARGTTPLVYSGTTQLTVPPSMQDYYNYKYHRIRFTAASGDKFKIQHTGSSAIYIDDVRLHPVTAQMQNWSYTPMFGAGINTDANGRPTFIEYDGQGRQEIIRDKDGNIISKTEYGIQ